MAVRGAPAIAISAALALAVDLTTNKKNGAEFSSAPDAAAYVYQSLDYLVTARPTAVNLADACAKLRACTEAAAAAPGASSASLCTAVVELCEHMLEQDVADCRAIGTHGAEAIMRATIQRTGGKRVRVLTHCNTGSLACAAYGTALGVIRRLFEEDLLEHAYCTETRPYNQGARLTAYELVYEGIPSTLICDSAACYLMSQGLVDAVIVGADRVTANGDTANKIGTYSLATAAKAHGIPFFVAAPTTSMDPALPTGDLIHIEMRPDSEITHNPQTGKRAVVDGIGIWNPSFDVTPGKLITGVISEKGLVPRDAASGDHCVRTFLDGLGLVRPDQKSVSVVAGARAGYEELNEESVKHYVASRPLIAHRVGSPDSTATWTVKEVGDGNINFVYIVEGPLGAVCVKQGRPYIRCVGESWPLTQERVRFEAECMRLFFGYCPEHIPEIYFYDERMSTVVMRFIEPPALILRKGLCAGASYPKLAEQVGYYLAASLYNTSLLALGTDKFRALQSQYVNTEMCRLTEQVVFTEPYFAASNNHWTTPQLDALVREHVMGDAALKAQVAELKRTFCERAEALLHGDLHTGSIMVTQDQMFVLDAEFAFVGPMGFDIGAFLGNLLLAYFAADGRATPLEPRTAQRAFLLEAVAATWVTFERHVRTLFAEAKATRGDAAREEVFGQDAAATEKFLANFLRGVFEDALGFAGCKMIRRIVGIAHVEDLEGIEDAEARAVCETRAILMARKLVLERKGGFASIQDVVKAAQEARMDGKRPLMA